MRDEDGTQSLPAWDYVQMIVRTVAVALIVTAMSAAAGRGYVDRQHRSKVFGENRHYRLFLPKSYATQPNTSFPVIYYFHGHSDRYTLEKYDDGKDTVPKIERFVAAHPIIVVAVDGFVAKEYQGFYGGAPWDISESGGQMDFGAYFLELTNHIDSTLRTRRSRRFRATAGLSMGGFMSLYLSARYPDRIGSASAFNPGPEFFTGEPGRRILWRPKDHVATHRNTTVRLIRASGDYISQYHEETKEAYEHATGVDFEYRRDEYHRHWATSIAETFEFHMRAFENASLDRAPQTWSYTCAYRECEVWGNQIRIDSPEACYAYIERTSTGGLSVRTRAWAPDGPSCASATVHVTSSANRYPPSSNQQVRDLNVTSRISKTAELRADPAGRLAISVDGNHHLVHMGASQPEMLPLTNTDILRLNPDSWAALPVRVYNPGEHAVGNVTVAVSSEYPTVEFESPSTQLTQVEPGQVVDVPLRARFTSSDRTYARVRLLFTIGQSKPVEQDLMVAPVGIESPWQFEVLDGRALTFSVFRQKGNQGGGGSVARQVREGSGNGNGVLEPGERATIWVRLKQGLDPFDKGNWYRTKVRSDSPCVQEVADIREQKQLEWTGAKERTSLIELVAGCENSDGITLTLENESWSYDFRPDVRYGRERLYQAFQKHRRHLWRIRFPFLSSPKP